MPNPANYYKLVMKTAHRYAKRSQNDVDDLIQSGMVELVKACNSFDGKGDELSYVMSRIRKGIQQAIRLDTLVTIPEYASNLGMQYRNLLADNPGLTNDEVKSIMGWDDSTLEKAQAAIAARPRPASIETDGDTTGIDIGVNMLTESGLLVDQLLSKLNDEERRVLRLRYYDNLTHDEVAAAIGATRTTSMNIEAKALQKMRKSA